MPEDGSQILPHAIEQGIKLVSERALQVVPAKPPIRFHRAYQVNCVTSFELVIMGTRSPSKMAN